MFNFTNVYNNLMCLLLLKTQVMFLLMQILSEHLKCPKIKEMRIRGVCIKLLGANHPG